MISLLSHTDVSNPNQAKTVANVLNNIVGGPPEAEVAPETPPATEPTIPGDGPAPTTTSTTTTTPSPDEGKKELEKLMDIAKKLTQVEGLAESIFPNEFGIRMGAVSPVTEIISDGGKFSENWKTLNEDPNSRGAQSAVQDLKNYLLYMAERREEVWDESGLSGEFHENLNGPNYGAEVFKTSPLKLSLIHI